MNHATPYDALFINDGYDLDEVGYLDDQDLELLRPAASRNTREVTDGSLFDDPSSFTEED